MFQTTPDDPRITDMDDTMKAYMFVHWMEDHKDEYEVAKYNSIITGSFINPEAAEKMASGEGVHVSSEEDVEESMKMVLEAGAKLSSNQNSKRKRKKIRLKE